MLGMPSLLVGTGPLPQKALAALPPSASLPTGTQYEVTDYGGNVAIVINGVWRFAAPFRTTWATRPPVALVSPGTELQATDYNSQKWICDGTYWRPAQGRVLIAQKSRTTGAALSVISGAAAAQFALAGGNPKIPAGMIIPGSKLRTEGGSVKSGTAASYLLAARLGKNGLTASDLAMGSVGGTLTPDGIGLRLDLLACFNTETNAFFRTGSTSPMGQAQGNMFMTSSSAIDTASDMYVTFDVLGGNTADSYSLGFYAIWLEA